MEKKIDEEDEDIYKKLISINRTRVKRKGFIPENNLNGHKCEPTQSILTGRIRIWAKVSNVSKEMMVF